MIWQLIDSSYIGGVERHIETLVTSLRRRGEPVEIVLYGNHGANPWFKQLEAAGLNYRFLDNTFSGLLKALRQHKPRLLHAHGYKAGVLGRIAARLAGVPVVASNHEPEFGPYPLNLYRRLDDWSSLLSTTIAVTEPISRRMPFKSHVLPNYTNYPPAPAARPLPRTAAFVGRVVDVKQPELFCRLARNSPKSIAWHVYGDGPLRPSLEAQFGDVVRFHGTVTDMAARWSEIGLLVMTSRSEGHPYAALEALGAGVPVLASPVGGLPGTVVPGTSGWLFDDVAGAERGLAEWAGLTEAQQIELRQSCYRHVTSHFSEAALLPRLLAIYREAGYRS